MSLQWVYISVVIIWSSTPLAIKLSNDSLSPLTSITLRIALALVLAIALALCLHGRSLLNRKHWLMYMAAGISLFPNMPLVYMAADYIPSGLISIMFALNPFITGLFAGLFLQEKLLTPLRMAGLLLALAGLGIVFMDQLRLGEDALLGMGLMVGSCLLFSASSVWTKKLGEHYRLLPLEQAVGSMLFALPGLALCWLLLDSHKALEFSATSLWALGYLAVIGSVAGFVAFYHILQHMSMSSVALIPLITPVLAVALGNLLAGEVISAQTLLGGGCIVVALALYQGRGSKLKPVV
jgi:drug/metabolite transporter (DMT)-like permease